MMKSFSTALSALSANATAIDVVGNNLANLNTTGFKQVSVEFTDLMSQSLGDRTQVGMGVGQPITNRNFGQGAIQPGSGPLTAAIQGQGFFAIARQNGLVYTRAGSFELNSTGQLVTTAGAEPVVGWNAVNGEVDTAAAAGPIQISTRSLPPRVTSALTVDMNLDVNAAVGATAAVPVTVTNSLGNQVVLTVTFTRTAAGWDYAVSAPGTTATATGASLTFNASGVLDTPPTGSTIAISGFADGAAPMSIEWSFIDATGSPRITQFARPSATSAVTQDGYPAADMTGLRIGDGGRVIATYSNGQEQIAALLGVANVLNPSALQAAGDNTFTASIDASITPVAPGGTGGRGQVIGQALEGSTVDIAREFTNLIIYQRGYQAASRIITTTDEISQETINLKR
jgi:flagellar hook protein FlgE